MDYVNREKANENGGAAPCGDTPGPRQAGAATVREAPALPLPVRPSREDQFAVMVVMEHGFADGTLEKSLGQMTPIQRTAEL
jgi:hypothetical protein